MPTVSKKITGEVVISPEIASEIQKEVKNIPALKVKIEESMKGRLSEILEITLAGTIYLGVSDIHIEPKEGETKIRVRVDGLLHEVLPFEEKTYKKLVSRIKLLSGLKLNIEDRPQDGRFSISMPEDTEQAITKSFTIEVRVSSLPTEYGETIVMRLLNPKSLISLEALGLRKDLAELFNKEISKPNGMIIVTGPTGSGKTTTLYAFLKKIRRSDNKIITIEDPIEYHLSGISQTQVDHSKGYDFANGLRSIMRQDPDIVLVGEIRDLETANIALQAALTGHLVFSTLHTNDAAGTIARLQSLGEKPVNIGPAINMVIGQRLVRKVCKKCFKKEKIKPQDLKKIKKALKNIPKEINSIKIDSKLKISVPVGCKGCNFTGYKGRTGIYEAFIIDDELEKFILTSPSIAGLREIGIKKGMILMYQSGMLKVIEGKTTIEEVERVAKD
jgi:type II secretory ATPase GspE/PulE/Tfp pilus assembly ATPase PilB-like protein